MVLSESPLRQVGEGIAPFLQEIGKKLRWDVGCRDFCNLPPIYSNRRVLGLGSWVLGAGFGIQTITRCECKWGYMALWGRGLGWKFMASWRGFTPNPMP